MKVDEGGQVISRFNLYVEEEEREGGFVVQARVNIGAVATDPELFH